MKIYSAIHLKICGFFDGDGGCAGAVSVNVLPCLPSTGAWHAPVIAPKEELSSGSSAALHGGQDIPALPVHAVLRWGLSYIANAAKTNDVYNFLIANHAIT